MNVDPVALIERKRDGGELTADDIAALVPAYLDGSVSDAQLSALFMAGVLQGFTVAEAVALTQAYLRSGDTVDLSGLPGPIVDKHSTGGVADTTTLVAGPVMAACGLRLVKLSGRGLGHTGGTLDKLEAIPGFRTDLTVAQLRAQVQEIGLVVAGATSNIVPADRRTYALRDVTGTVPSPALIAASVMSKKIAGGAEHVVLNVTVGDGAFMATVGAARGLATLCVDIGRANGLNVAALVTDMDQPLGPAVGNALEVRAAVAALRGQAGRLTDASIELAAAALRLSGTVTDLEAGRVRARSAIADGSALERFRRIVAAQGGDPAVCDRPDDVLSSAPAMVEALAEHDGVVTHVAARHIGDLAVTLGAGRRHQGDVVDPAVGFELLVEVSDEVHAGQPLARVHARTSAQAQQILPEVVAAFTLGASAAAQPLVLARVGLD